MRIKSIRLINFQAHKDQLIKLSPRITTIAGATDRGKSAILRALGWCCLNNIAGDEFVREGEKETEVTITTHHQNEETVIKRTRSAGGAINTYQIGGRTHKAFGQGVPQVIADHLAVNEINFQGQHDRPFWFAETPGEISRRLNAVIDLSVIDSSLSAVAQEVRASQDRKKLCEERLQRATDELEALKPQEQRVAEFHQLERLKEKSDELEERYGELYELIEAIVTNPAKQHEARCSNAKEVLHLAGEARSITDRVNTLTVLVVKIEKYQKKSTPPPSFAQLEEAYKRLLAAEEQLTALEDNIDQLSQNESKLEEAEDRLEAAEQILHRETKGQKCPLCGNRIQ